MTTMIDLFSNFFLNDLLGSVVLGVIFLVLLILAFLLFSDAPKIILALIPTMLFFGLSNSGYVPIWIGAISWIIMGILWSFVIKKLIND